MPNASQDSTTRLTTAALAATLAAAARRQSAATSDLTSAVIPAEHRRLAPVSMANDHS